MRIPRSKAFRAFRGRPSPTPRSSKREWQYSAICALAGRSECRRIRSICADNSGDGYIEGLIVDEANDAPIATGGVSAYDLSGEWVAEGVFMAEGGYRIGPIPAGSYRIGFHDDSAGYQDEWWQDRVDPAEADSVVVTAGETTGGVVFMVSRSARPGEGWIEGRLFLAETGEAPPVGFRLAVDAYDATGGYAGGAVAWTGPGGSYRLPLPAGTHRLEFIDSSAFAYQGTWWFDKASLASADPVAVAAGETTIGVDWPLRLREQTVPPQDGMIEGRLFLADTGAPLPAGFRLNIRAFDDTGSLVWEENAWTDSDGRYQMAMPSGVLRLEFIDSSAFAYEGVGCPCTNLDGDPTTAWWPAAATFAGATPVEVVAGAVTPDVDWPLRLREEPVPPLQPAVAADGELPFGGLEVSSIAGIAIALLTLGGLLVAGSRWEELRPAHHP